MAYSGQVVTRGSEKEDVGDKGLASGTISSMERTAFPGESGKKKMRRAGLTHPPSRRGGREALGGTRNRGKARSGKDDQLGQVLTVCGSWEAAGAAAGAEHQVPCCSGSCSRS